MTVSITVPDEAAQVLEILRGCLMDRLLAVYLHGSAVAGGLRPHSDVDILAVVDRGLTIEQRRTLAGRLMSISAYPAREGGPRPVEVIILQLSDLQPLGQPPRADFVYGEWLRADFEAGELAQPVRDPEFVAVIAGARQSALTLSGPPAAEFLPAVSAADLCRAMRQGLPALLATLDGDERNVLLTLTRMWHTLETGIMAPKDMAAQWAVARLPAEAAGVVAFARRDYLGPPLAGTEWRRQGRAVRLAAECLAAHVKCRLD